MNDTEELLAISSKVSKFVVGAEGNISKRIDNDFIIKASGVRIDSITDEDFVRCTLSNNETPEFTSNKRPSMEYEFHSILYSMNTNINYIIHTHPVNVMKIVCSSMIDSFAKNRFFPDQVVYNERKSCVIPYAHPGKELSNIISRHVEMFLNEEGFFPNTILLKNHGLITVGKTMKNSIIATEICEKAAEIFLGSCDMDLLEEVDINRLVNDKYEHYRKNLG